MQQASKSRSFRCVMSGVSALLVLVCGWGMVAPVAVADDSLAEVEAAQEALEAAVKRARAEIEPDLEVARQARNVARNALNSVRRDLEREWNEGAGKELVEAFETAREAFRTIHHEQGTTSDVVAAERSAYREAEAANQAGLKAALEADERYKTIMTEAEPLFKELEAAHQSQMKAVLEYDLKDFEHHVQNAMRNYEARDKARNEMMEARERGNEARHEARRIKNALDQLLRNDLRDVSNELRNTPEIRALRDAQGQAQREWNSAVNELPDVATAREVKRAANEAMNSARGAVVDAAIAADPEKTALLEARKKTTEAVTALEQELRSIR